MTDRQGDRVVATVIVSTPVSRGSTEDVVHDLLPGLRQGAVSVEADPRVPSSPVASTAGQPRGMPV